MMGVDEGLWMYVGPGVVFASSLVLKLRRAMATAMLSMLPDSAAVCSTNEAVRSILRASAPKLKKSVAKDMESAKRWGGERDSEEDVECVCRLISERERCRANGAMCMQTRKQDKDWHVILT